jgi:flavin-dependent dehydrogenase
VLIIGGGPAGLSAAIELGKLGIQTLLIDDKHRLGGKLVCKPSASSARPRGVRRHARH